MKRYRIILPLEVWDDFEDDMDEYSIKQLLGEQLDALLIGTDYLGDYWKHAKVEEF